MLLLDTTGQNFVSFSASLMPIDVISWTDQNCTVANISTSSGSTKLLSRFNTNSDDYLSFSINVDDTSVALLFTLYSEDNCTQIQSVYCYAGSYPCAFPTDTSLAIGGYYIFITDYTTNWFTDSDDSDSDDSDSDDSDSDSDDSDSSSFYNLTMSFSYGNMACMNITSQLYSCAGYLSPDDYYNIQTSVAEYEYQAIVAYNTLAALWPYDCSSTLWSYACKSVFQPRLCNSTGNNTLYCYNDCLDTLQNQCLNGSEANLCQKNTCTTVSNLITECPSSNNATASPLSHNLNTNGNYTYNTETNSGNLMNSWFLGLLLIIVNWLVAIQ